MVDEGKKTEFRLKPEKSHACLYGAQVCNNCDSVYVFYVLPDVCKCDVFMCFDMCGVVVVVESSLFLLSACCMLRRRMERSVCDFCLTCDV